MADTESIIALVERFRAETPARWLSAYSRSQYKDDNPAKDMSQAGDYFDPNFVYQSDVVGHSHGGFFPAITAENLDERLTVLFPDDGGAFLKRHLEPPFFSISSMTPEQEKFVELYDRFTVAIYNPDRFSEAGYFNDFTYATQDGTITDHELRMLFHRTKIAGEISELGELAPAFIVLTGGVLQGKFDYNEALAANAFNRLNVAEIEPFLSPEARDQIHELTTQAYWVIQESTTEETAANFMNGACGTRFGYELNTEFLEKQRHALSR